MVARLPDHRDEAVKAVEALIPAELMEAWRNMLASMKHEAP